MSKLKASDETRMQLMNVVNLADRIRAEHGDKCLHCEKYDVGSGFCSQWQDVVPKEARLDGCDQWVDFIPF